MRAFVVALLLMTGCAAGPRTAPRRFDGFVYPYRGGTPVLLVHGALVGGGTLPLGYSVFSWATVRALQQAGFYVLMPALPAAAPPTERAAILAEAIDRTLRWTRASQVIIIAHSQGGVDARVLLADEHQRTKIAAVATLSTPHHGTPLAEIGEQMRGGIFETLVDRWARRLAESRGWRGREGHSRGLMAALTPREMAKLDHVGTGGVPLFSLAAALEPAKDGSCDGGRWPAPTTRGHRDFFGKILGAIIADLRGPGHADDGVVPTDSQRWGHFLGCAPISHIGWLNARDGRFETSAFLVELARALDEVRQSGDAAMDAHVPALAHFLP